MYNYSYICITKQSKVMTSYQKSILEKLQELLTLIDYEEIVRDYRENLINGTVSTTKTVEVAIGEDKNSLTADLIISYTTDENSLETTVDEVRIESANYNLHEDSLSSKKGSLSVNTSNDIVYFL